MTSKLIINEFILQGLDDHVKYVEKVTEILIKLKELRVLMSGVFEHPIHKDFNDEFICSLNEQMDQSIDNLSDEQDAIVKIISDLCYDSMQKMLYTN